MRRELKGSVYEDDLELLRDVLVDLVEEDGTSALSWGGTFKRRPELRVEVGASYTLKLEDWA